MHNPLLRFILAVLTLMPAGAHSTEVTGDWVAKRMSDRDTGSDSRVEMRMELIDSRGRITNRDLFMVRKEFDGMHRMLIRFTRPADIRGTSFLVWEHEAEEDERFLYLPALGRTRRITSAEKTDSFAGTDFTYEDISGLEYEDFTYRLLGDSTITTGEECYILESVPKKSGADYARSLALVDKESFLPMSSDYIDSRGRTIRHFSLIRKEKIEGIWTMTEMTMDDLENNHRTHIVTTSVRYNQGIEDRMFTRRELERGAQ
ncbi:MAG: outer membrane lipoprotein-sorting protein [Candidatus Glassbacteria bacterium]